MAEQDPLTPGEIFVARVKQGDQLLIISGDRRRSVTVAPRGVAELVGVSEKGLTTSAVRMLAPELLRNPRLAYGRIEMCEEMHDPERNGAQLQSGDESTHPWVDRDHSDDWKKQGDGGEGPES